MFTRNICFLFDWGVFVFCLSFKFVWSSDVSWKEGRSQVFLSEDDNNSVSVFVERDCFAGTGYFIETVFYINRKPD